MHNPKHNWMTVRQAADYLGVSIRTIKRYIASGELPYSRLPSPGGLGHLRIRRNDLDAMFANGLNM